MTLADTVTGKNGRVYSSESGDHYAVETEAADGFKLDDTPIYFTVKDGETTARPTRRFPASSSAGRWTRRPRNPRCVTFPLL